MKLKFFFLSVCFSLTSAAASGSSDDLAQKLFEAANNPAVERHISQIISQIEKGQIDQVTQSTLQTFFRIAPNGQLSEESLEREKARSLARNRAQLMGQYLIYDLDGDGAIGSVETEGLSGNLAAQLISLRAFADKNQNGDISTEELLSAATARAQQKSRGDQYSYLMAFDLNDDDVVNVDEILTALRTLAGRDLTANTVIGTTGTFAKATDKPTPNEVFTTNADGLPIELHMVGIYEPTTGRFSNPLVGKRLPVEIQVDRPGVAVTLVLGSHEPAQWIIRTSEGTQIEKIIASNRNRPRGEFILNGEKVWVTYLDLPIAHEPRGNQFQPFHTAAAQAAGTERAASFNGAYKAPLEGFIINEGPGVPTSAEVEVALTAQALPASELPSKLRDAFEGKIAVPGLKWTLRDEGFVGQDGNKTTIHKLPLEAPEVSRPVGVAYDPEGQRLWGVTRGYLYDFDIAKKRWTARSMKNVDVGGIIFDPATGNLITTPGPRGRSGYMILDSSGKELSSLKISQDDYPGLIETYDPGNGPRPSLVPVMIEGDLLLVRATAELRPTILSANSRWFYLVDLQSGKVRLVR